MRRLLLLLLLTAAWLPARARQPLKIVFYNVENLFDTDDDPAVRDDAFTPRGAMRWTEARCTDKLRRLARVLADIDASEGGPAAVIGLAEIETPALTERLARRLSALRAPRPAAENPATGLRAGHATPPGPAHPLSADEPSAGAPDTAPATPPSAGGAYALLHEESPDPRGIDVALLYRPDLFELEGHRAEPLDPAAPSRRTRDLLTAWGRLCGQPCFFLVAHLPSRRGGDASAALRLAAGRRMRAIVDSVRRADPGLRVVVMGDLNDDPVDPSVARGLGALFSVADTGPGGLYNPFFDLFRAGRGTLVYDRTWQLFDQILVSDNLLGNGGDGSPCATARPAGTPPSALPATAQTAIPPPPAIRPSDAPHPASTPPAPHPAADAPATPSLRLARDPATGFRGTIFAPAYLLQRDGRYRGCPLRTYSERRYVGGYSDHLPVWIRLE